MHPSHTACANDDDALLATTYTSSTQVLAQETCTERLDLETTRSSTTTSTLELATLALDVWLLVLMWAEAEVLDSLTGILWSTEQESVGTSWGTLRLSLVHLLCWS
jgi:hypothetical protein